MSYKLLEDVMVLNNVVKLHSIRMKYGEDMFTMFLLKTVKNERKSLKWKKYVAWVTWVNSELIQDMMILNHVVNFHENQM